MQRQGRVDTAVVAGPVVQVEGALQKATSLHHLDHRLLVGTCHSQMKCFLYPEEAPGRGKGRQA